MTVEELKQRYKVIEAKRINDDIVSVDLFHDEEKSNLLHIKLLFAYGKLYYTGDFGTYVFGENICNIFNFFKGERINEGYWQEKCEASSYPIYPSEVDEEKVEELVKEYVCDLYRVENYDELDEEIKDVIEDKFRFGIETNEIRAYDEIDDF